MNIFSILTVIFVVAKITNYIDWSWWLVFTPTIIQILFVLFYIVLASYIEVKDKNKKRLF